MFEKLPREVVNTIAISCKKFGTSTLQTDNLNHKRQKLEAIINHSQDEELSEAIQDIENTLKEADAVIAEAREELKSIEEEYREKREKLSQAKEDKKTRLELKLEAFQEKFYDDEDLVKERQRKQELEAVRARQMREKQRKRALISYAKGVAAAVIDNEQVEFVETANALANQTIEKTKIYCEKMEIEEIKTTEELVAFNVGMNAIIEKEIDPVIKATKEAMKSRAKSTSKTKQKQTVKASR